MIRRLLIPLLLSLLAVASAQDSPPIATLAPPTLVPANATPLPPAGPPLVSAVADIAASGVFRVGLLYNNPPYSQLTLRGEVSGFDAELLRKLAAAWDCEIEFVQVTRLNALDKLKGEQAHAVAAALVHYRDMTDQVDFSQTYLRGAQALLVAADSPYQHPAELGEQPIGHLLGSRTEKALDIFAGRLGRTLSLRPYLTLDRGLAALTRGEIAALAAEAQDLLRLAADSADGLRLLDAPLLDESRALAVRRQDAPMRQLINRTLQLLASQGELDTLFREYFPDASYEADILPLWSGIGEAVAPDQFAVEIQAPADPALPRLMSSGVLRVAGATDGSQATSAGQMRLAELNRALVSEIAARWGLDLQLVAGDASAAVDLLNSGLADLVVGVTPDWGQSASLDYSAPYLRHGDRLMTRVNSGIAGSTTCAAASSAS